MEETAIYEIDLNVLRKRLSKKVEITIPHISVISEANTMDHWTKKRRRRIAQDSIIRLYWGSNKLYDKILCDRSYVIILSRICSRKLDSDNLQMAFKAIRDTIADILIPGKKRGVADSNPGLTWIYDQIKGPKGIKIEIYAKEKIKQKA